MNDKPAYQIMPLPGYAPQIGQLISMMNYTRRTTLRAVQGLNVEQLDYLLDDQSNSIGELLSHITAIEALWQIRSFQCREPDEQEMNEWWVAGKLGDRARQTVKGNPLSFYIEKLASVRDKTLQELNRRDDDWLYAERTVLGKEWQNYFIGFTCLKTKSTIRDKLG